MGLPSHSFTVFKTSRHCVKVVLTSILSLRRDPLVILRESQSLKIYSKRESKYKGLFIHLEEYSNAQKSD